VYPVIELAPPYRQLVRDMMSLMSPIRRETWLDLGCGSGIMTLELLRSTAGNVSVVALDCSRIMLNHFRSRLDTLIGRTNSVTLLQADIRKPMPFDSACFDGIAANLVLPYVDKFSDGSVGDQALISCLIELRTILREGGRLVWSTPREDASFPRIFILSWRALMRPEVLWKGTRLLWYAQELKRRAQTGRYHYLPRSSLKRVMKAAGYRSVTIRQSYMGEGWVIRGLR
jgi:ubiquinone/menaquinone biosynthesis C-methylase UbiE